MKYLQESEKLRISVKEFVTIARRGISKTLPTDEEEPKLENAKSKEKEKLINTSENYKLSYEFNGNEHRFELYGEPDCIDSDKITLIFKLDYSPKKLKKQDREQCRGEGYIFAKMLLEKENLHQVILNFIYLDKRTAETVENEEILSSDNINKFFSKCKDIVEKYAVPQIERVTVRLPSMEKLKFPYSHIRDGQSEFVKTVFRSIAKGNTLFACAPTGTGKTVSTIYPAIRALGGGRVEKIFYLTPKTTTAQAAVDCVKLLCENGGIIRGIALTSKEKCCRNGLLCHENRKLCENSKVNNLPDATLALYNLNKPIIDKNDISSIAKSYTVCPYELELCYSELCDIIICDFNYLFDPTVYIRRFFDCHGDYAFLIDEAHNLQDRAREMYSTEISSVDFTNYTDSVLLGDFSTSKNIIKEKYTELFNTLYPYLSDSLRKDKSGNDIGATHLSEIPPEVYNLTEDILASLEDELLQSYRTKDSEKTQRIKVIREFYFKIKKFDSILNLFDDSYIMILFYKSGNLTVKLFNIDTNNVIRKRLNLGKSSVLFSATLEPLDYYKSILGGDGSSETISFRSPFAPEQLSVSIMDKISTRTSERERTLPAVCKVIGATLSSRRGNYMVFAPSFEYADALSKVFSSIYPKIRVLTQRKNMSSDEKNEFLSAFSEDDKKYLVGFCVLGGIYSEGIDLVGDSLIGAIVVGIGMPSLSYEREAMAEYFQNKYDSGKEYAYIYPGMNRVLQASGRVIRNENDRGVIVLIDDRFDDPIYKKSIPSLWKGMEYVADAKTLNQRLKDFWQGVDSEK